MTRIKKISPFFLGISQQNKPAFVKNCFKKLLSQISVIFFYIKNNAIYCNLNAITLVKKLNKDFKQLTRKKIGKI